MVYSCPVGSNPTPCTMKRSLQFEGGLFLLAFKYKTITKLFDFRQKESVITEVITLILISLTNSYL